MTEYSEIELTIMVDEEGQIIVADAANEDLAERWDALIGGTPTLVQRHVITIRVPIPEEVTAQTVTLEAPAAPEPATVS
jgi:hypothetical protein